MNTSDNAPLIAAGGGLLFFISLLLDWTGTFNVWESSDILDVVLALLAVLAVVVGGSRALGNPVGPGGDAVYAAGLFCFAIVASAVLEGDERKFGLFLALLGTIGMILGGLQLGRGGTTAAPRTRASEPTAPPPPPPASTQPPPGPGV